MGTVQHMEVEFLDDEFHNIFNTTNSATKNQFTEFKDKRNSSNSNPINNETRDAEISHYRGKCAEVFFQNGSCCLVCDFCEINFKENIVMFKNHMYDVHFRMKNPLFDEENTTVIENQRISNDIKQKNEVNQINITVEKKNEEEIYDKDILNIDDDDSAESEYNDNEVFNLEPFEDNAIQIRNEALEAEVNNKIVFYDQIISSEPKFVHKDGYYHCHFCKLKFREYKELMLHYEQHRYQPTPYKCSFCSDSFGKQKFLYYHQKNHSDCMSLNCDFCKKHFFHQNDYNVHMKRHPQSDHVL